MRFGLFFNEKSCLNARFRLFFYKKRARNARFLYIKNPGRVQFSYFRPWARSGFHILDPGPGRAGVRFSFFEPGWAWGLGRHKILFFRPGPGRVLKRGTLQASTKRRHTEKSVMHVIPPACCIKYNLLILPALRFAASRLSATLKKPLCEKRLVFV